MFWLDIVIITVLGFGALWGLFTGFLWQVSRVLTVILAVYCSILLNAPTTHFLQSEVLPKSSQIVCQLVAYAVIFLAVGLSMFVATALLNRFVEKIELQWLNRLLGATLGFAKAGLIVGLITLGMTNFPPTKPIMEKSVLSEPVIQGFQVAMKLIPNQEFLNPETIAQSETAAKDENAKKQTPTVPNHPKTKIEIRFEDLYLQDQARKIAGYLKKND